MNDNLKGLTFTTSLSRQKISAVIRALDGLEEKRSDVPDLLKRLQSAIGESITSLQFSGEEIYDIINALRKAFKETLSLPDRRYGFLSVDELQELLEDFEKLSRKR